MKKERINWALEVLPETKQALLLKTHQVPHWNPGQVAGAILDAWAKGEAAVSFPAGFAASLNAVRAVLLTTPATAREISEATALTVVTVRTSLERLKASGEVNASLPSRERVAGRPSFLWALTDKGRAECVARSILPLNTDATPLEKHANPEDYEQKLFKVFAERPGRRWTITELRQRLNVSEQTIRKHTDRLLLDGEIEEAGTIKGSWGKNPMTYRLKTEVAPEDAAVEDLGRARPDGTTVSFAPVVWTGPFYAWEDAGADAADSEDQMERAESKTPGNADA